MNGMTTLYEQGDIVVVFLPFKQEIGVAIDPHAAGKRRPVLIVSVHEHNRGDDLTVAQLTSKIGKAQSRGEYVINRWREAGLYGPTAIRPKLYVIRKSAVVAKIGKIQAEDTHGLTATLRSLFGL